MRTYLILKEKAQRFALDSAIQELIQQIQAQDSSANELLGPYSRVRAEALQTSNWDRQTLGRHGQPYERLDQLVVDLLLGVR